MAVLHAQQERAGDQVIATTAVSFGYRALTKYV